MPRLTPAELRGRLTFDWRVLCAMRWTPECKVTGYVSAADAARGRAASEAEGEAGLVTVYDADYRFPMLSAPSKRLDHVRVRIDLLAGGNFPFSTPLAQVLTRPFPYSTHVAPGNGAICVGEGWPRALGKILAAQLVVHCMKCFNYDEPDRGPGYGGYTPEAHRFWREKLRCRPLNPGLAYPALPLHLTHGIVDAAILFEDAGGQGAGRAPVLFEDAAPGAPLFEDAGSPGDGPGFAFAEVP